jgi:hypothetical protein
MRPRLAIESAERIQLGAKSGQNSDDARFVLLFDVEDTGLDRWKYCAMPILKIAV